MKHQAFTLVELIVVVTILAILATIGFVSYSGYLTGVRDTNRIASLTAISDGLELYRTRNDLPDPDDAIDIQIEGVDIAHQGYVGSNVLQTIEYSKAGKDPKDDNYYSYYLTDDKKYYQLMAFLEEGDNLETNIISQSKAATDYKNRSPKVYGKRLGILTDDNNSPVQEIITGVLNITSTSTGVYKSYLTDSESYTGTGAQLLAGVISKKIDSNYKSCKDILDNNSFTLGANDYYKIKTGGNKIIKVYCDMTTDGGGWTQITADMIDDEINENNIIAKSTDVNRGLIYRFTTTGTIGGCGGTGIASMKNQIQITQNIDWDSIRYHQKFISSASCWGIFGHRNEHLLQPTNLLPFVIGTDTIYNEVQMGTQSSDAYVGPNTRCDNTLQNFWHNNNGSTINDIREATVILRKDTKSNPSYISTFAACISNNSASEYSNIYIK